MARLRHSWIALALLGLPVFCQQPRYKDLATTVDGSALYFSSWLRPKGSDGPLHAKIFVSDATGVRVFAQVEANRSGYVSNHYLLDKPVVSGNGSLVGFTATAVCTGSQTHCGGYTGSDWYHAELGSGSV